MEIGTLLTKSFGFLRGYIFPEIQDVVKPEVPRDRRLANWIRNPPQILASSCDGLWLVAGAGYAECYAAPETYWIDLK